MLLPSAQGRRATMTMLRKRTARCLQPVLILSHEPKLARPPFSYRRLLLHASKAWDSLRLQSNSPGSREQVLKKAHEANTTLPKTFVIGADGFVGRALLAAYRRIHPTADGTSRREASGYLSFDLSSQVIPFLGQLKKEGYSQAVIAAAMTGIAQCEREPKLASQINVDATLTIAGQLVDVGIRPVLFSSDYVFDGDSGGYDESAVPSPLNVYGETKAELERRVGSVCGEEYLLIRMSKVFGLSAGDGTLLNEMASQLATGYPLSAAVDQVFCPTLIDDIVRATLALQASDARGLFNVCSPESWTRHNLAYATARAVDADPRLVKPISLAELNEDCCRPKRTNLICKKLLAKGLSTFTRIEDCVATIAKALLRHDRHDADERVNAA